MKPQKNTFLIIGLLAILTGGCAGPKTSQQMAEKSKQQDGIPSTSPALRMKDHHEWVKRLLVTPPVEAIQLTAGNNAATVYPVPLLPTVTTAGTSYSVKIDPQAQLIWLQSHGYNGQVQKVDGPWKMDQPDAAHLLHSITNPPGNSSANPTAGL